jgi:DNA-binding CsgD family transcriptional regulator
MTGAAGTEWASGVEYRSRALLNTGARADDLYRRAIDHLSRSRAKVELARAHLLYGEWLRGERRRVDAREHLRAAHGQFVAMGAEGFTERARRELTAIGEATPSRPTGMWEKLTDQEIEIARLAAARRTNSEIGTQLFLSPRTVEWHLGKIFGKVGVSSRKELYDALPKDVRESTPS